MSTTATLSADQIGQTVREAFPFAVDKFRLSGPDGMRTDHFGLFRDDSGQCIGAAVTSKYLPHTVDDVSALAEAAASAFEGGAQVHAYWRDGHHLTIAPTKEYRREVFGTDTIWPRLIVSARYDGRAFRSWLGGYRDACKNLSIPRLASGQEVSAVIRHTHALRGRIDSLAQTFRHLAARWDNLVEAMRELHQRDIDLAEFLRGVYPLPADASRRTQSSYLQRVRQITSRIMRERAALGQGIGQIGRVTAWEAVNAVQGYVQHDQRRNGRPDSFARALMALDAPAVSRAWDLALAV